MSRTIPRFWSNSGKTATSVSTARRADAVVLAAQGEVDVHRLELEVADVGGQSAGRPGGGRDAAEREGEDGSEEAGHRAEPSGGGQRVICPGARIGGVEPAQRLTVRRRLGGAGLARPGPGLHRPRRAEEAACWTAARSFYCGFDPTAPSLHLGNLVQLLTMRRLQLAGPPAARPGRRRHRARSATRSRPPSARSTPRSTVAEWVGASCGPRSSRSSTSRARTPPGWSTTWTGPRRCSAHRLPARHRQALPGQHDAQEGRGRARLNTDAGHQLHRVQLPDPAGHGLPGAATAEHGCVLQTGGSDQWGNLTSGTDLIHTRRGASRARDRHSADHQLRRHEVRQERGQRHLARCRDDQPVRVLPVLAQHRRRRRDRPPQGLHVPHPRRDRAARAAVAARAVHARGAERARPRGHDAGARRGRDGGGAGGVARRCSARATWSGPDTATLSSAIAESPVAVGPPGASVGAASSTRAHLEPGRVPPGDRARKGCTQQRARGGRRGARSTVRSSPAASRCCAGGRRRSRACAHPEPRNPGRVTPQTRA